ncbi:MbtH protein [Kitasatospora sp. GAS204A]|uniref:MbtH family protein n=1 Tax=unclassified Kitasatospora TaxID=2633591 RepID=UPI00247589D0|nr:MbtH family NRPS accessory protein [Kitasatospora sp. GAS204B]MDH6118953.1 MbtH protein [Kitasatospora sp. GAS204B]
MEDDDIRTYTVVLNDEGQYSIWFAGRAAPAGWSEAGHQGTRAECLDFIESAWTDMRPRSVREFHAAT